jgi:uncharacterized protein with NAD-binding domain and iron-sulfur cluster
LIAFCEAVQTQVSSQIPFKFQQIAFLQPSIWTIASFGLNFQSYRYTTSGQSSYRTQENVLLIVPDLIESLLVPKLRLKTGLRNLFS